MTRTRPKAMRWAWASLVVALAGACGFVPADPPHPYSPPLPRPAPVTQMAAEGPARRPLLIGEMCPDAAEGRPAVRALVARHDRIWVADPDELRKLLARGRTGRFGVLSFEGKRAGTFTAAGPIDLGTRWPAAMGGYAGAGPCEPEPSSKARDPQAAAARTSECESALRTCGLAVAPLGGDPDETIELEGGGTCVEGGSLLVQVEAAGAPVAFPLDSFNGPQGKLAEEVSGKPGAKATPACVMRFGRAAVDARGRPAKPGGRALDVLGVLDLDGDGRRELVVQLRDGARRVWGVYAASQSSARLVLVAMAAPTER